MGIGISLILIAVGAVLTFAVHATVSGLDINTVGWILMGVGFLGFLVALTFLDTFRDRRTVSRTVQDDRL
jgi:hypothetical protein